MAVLTEDDRRKVWAKFMQSMSTRREACAVTKHDLRDAVNAIDAWVDANVASFNSAIPLPARTALTPKQKAELLFYVVFSRFEVN